VPRQIALLRGINVGKHAQLPMADLKRLLEDAGYEDITTHLRSGNVVLSAGATKAKLEAELEALLKDELRSPIRVVVRDAKELAAIVKANPLADVADNPSRKLVNFLSAKLDATVAKELTAAAKELAPEALVVRGREIYSWHPDGMHASPLAKLLTDKRLQVTVTNRNWNTVTKLLELVTA
jgi:uncharacterized protein (DUF1697 family)